MDDTWSQRDLPILNAIVEAYDRTGRKARPGEIQSATGFDEDTVERGLRALTVGGYLGEGTGSFGGTTILVGMPTGEAYRAVGAWPTPELQLDRLIAALNDAASDETRGDEERGKLKQAATWLGSFASQVAIGALGGAGGNMLS